MSNMENLEWKKPPETVGKKIIRHFLGGNDADVVGVCKDLALNLRNLVGRGNLLKQRQCKHLASKLSTVSSNVEMLLLRCKARKRSHFNLALKFLCQQLETAELLVQACGEENWLAAAIFQIQNENDFREILLDVVLCCNVIYEQAKSMSEEWTVEPKDLWLDSSSFLVKSEDILQDKLDLQGRIAELANESSSTRSFKHLLPIEVSRCLASYLLAKMQLSSGQAQQVIASDTRTDPLLWQKENEPLGTWGPSKDFLGIGAIQGGVWSTKWLGIPCAKKEFPDKEYESSFLQEAKTMAGSKHPRIIGFLRCGNEDGAGDRFIAMELMQKSLSKLIEDQKEENFQLPVVVDIIVQIARGMCYLHDTGVAHRDLKPQNVVVKKLNSSHVGDHYCVKLVDFGTSRTHVEDSKSNTINTCEVNLGTTMYRAPELHGDARRSRKGRAYWFKADVFSFALTCAHVLTLRRPFEGVGGLYNAVMNGRRPKLPGIYPEELSKILRDCWNTIPSNRPRFLEICVRLETLRHKVLRGLTTANERTVAFIAIAKEMGVDYIKAKLAEQSSLHKVCIGSTNEETEGDDNKSCVVAVTSCARGHSLALSETPAYYESKIAECNVCRQTVCGKVYHCAACQFDAHPECAEIEDMVEVCFHEHPLHLLVRGYYRGNADQVCGFCQESFEDSEWVYRCDECNLDAHALCTKFPKRIEDRSLHRHPLTLIESRGQSLLSSCCNEEVRGLTWHYKCKWKTCAFYIHPSCLGSAGEQPCIFDRSHRLSVDNHQKSFHCGRCGGEGFSWCRFCHTCDLRIHLDCMDGFQEENGDWRSVYEKWILEYEIMDDHAKMEMISLFLDRVLLGTPLEAHSSSNPGALQAQKISTTESPNVDSFADESLRREIAAQTKERKAKKKIAVKEARCKLNAQVLEILNALKKLVEDLQCSVLLSQVQGKTLSIALQKLNERLSTL